MTQDVAPNQAPNQAPADVAPAGTDIQGSAAPADVLPMLDREQFRNPESAAPAGDALLEGEQPNQLQETEPDNTEPVDYETTSLREMIGSELLQEPGASLVAISLMRLMHGADHNRAFAKALEYGDPRFIDTTYLNEKLGNDTAVEVVKAAEYLLNYTDQKIEDMKNRLYSSVEGGEQAIQLAAKHFRTSAPREEQRAIAQMLDSGDMDIMQYALRQIMQYGAQVPQGAVKPQTRHTVAQTGLQPLSRAEFGKMVLDNPNMSEQEYNALSARLQAGMQPRR